MRTARVMRVIGWTVGVALVAACSDMATQPTASPDASASLLEEGVALENLVGESVNVLKRSKLLAEDEVVTKVIGPSGGVISLPTAGLNLLIPPGGVAMNTSITVIAPAGDLVGYHFFPEGLTFQEPALAVQSLTATEAALPPGASALFAAYFQGGLAETVEALEVLPLSLTGRLGLFEIEHFSGYVVATN